MEVVRSIPAEVVRAEDFMPLMTVAQAVDRKRQMNEFIAGVMTEGEDYGFMPGDKRSEKKKVLLKPGAEKLCSIFGLSPRYVVETSIEDWTGKEHGGEPLFYYEYRCQLYRGDRFMGEGIGSANSWEAKHRYRWVTSDQLPGPKDSYVSRGGRRTLSEPKFAVDKAETGGQYGKPAEHWQMFKEAIVNGTAREGEKEKKTGGKFATWEIDIDQTTYRVPNPDCADLVNTLQKMAQKRAQVAAVLVVTNCSDAFTQDLEEHSDDIDTGGHPAGTQAAANHVRDEKLKQAEKSASLPPEIQTLLDNIHKPGYAVDALRIIRDQLLQALPTAGEDEYKRILKKHGYVKGETVLTPRIVGDSLVEMYAVIDFARKQQAQTIDGKFTATDDDVPDNIGSKPLPFDTLDTVGAKK
jgi:hypothetical protein